MELTRRDAIAALAAAGVAGGSGSIGLQSGSAEQSNGVETAPDELIEDDHVATLVAAAEVLYPSELENIEAFVTQYIEGRAGKQPESASAIAETIGYLNEYSNAWYDKGFAGLQYATREEVFRRMNADTADPVPDGSDVERVRYHIINELLFALYTTPTGGKLVGLENPQGHPGGLGSYTQGPDI